MVMVLKISAGIAGGYVEHSLQQPVPLMIDIDDVRFNANFG